ncbi:hypothetical protein GUJ93_ZPchr0013g35322 [Zizania palustris]|uniref:SAP domain-containing protein n=1 Tax=Zizania palustris TaxID=103762 RepID=A0A8J5X2K7_ZIZPA|nr:hypothetical protein GUJ93_ZPchr0013g35322 [Zizania palustris]
MEYCVPSSASIQSTLRTPCLNVEGFVHHTLKSLLPDHPSKCLASEYFVSGPGVVKAIDEFKASVYGENYDLDESEAAAAKAGASKKRKASTDAAAQKSAAYDWAELADTGKLKDMTVVELKSYLTAHDLPVSGKKEALISRILTHLGK